MGQGISVLPSVVVTWLSPLAHPFRKMFLPVSWCGTLFIELHANPKSLPHISRIPTCEDGPDPYDARQLVREGGQRRERRRQREDCGRHLVKFTSAVVI